MTGFDKILLPTAYFPPASYFALIIKSDKVLIEIFETYPKQTYRNRCEIMTSAGKQNLVVPVTKSNGNHTLTKDVKICNREPWSELHWKSLESAYRSSPYFNYYADLFHPLFSSVKTSLVSHNMEILSLVCKIMKIDLSATLTEGYLKNPSNIHDLRLEMTPKKKRTGLLFREYPQVFSYKFGFMEDLSILDLLFNIGPDSKRYLESLYA
jgi:hypothetical protein